MTSRTLAIVLISLALASGCSDKPAASPSHAELLAASMKTPRYVSAAVVISMRQDVLDIEDPAERQRRFELTRTRYGVGHARGMLMALTVAQHPQAVASLHGLSVLEPDYETSVSQHVLADMIDKFDPTNPSIDPATVELLTELANDPVDVYDAVDRRRAEGNDYLALACMRRLVGKGHDALIRRYIDSRIEHAEHHGGALREMKEKIAKE